MGEPKTLTRIRLDSFTAFRHLDLDLSPGINVLIGPNGTGKTHLMKVLYSACDVTRTTTPVAEKLVRVFLPFERRIGRLVHRQQGSANAIAEVYRGARRLRIAFSNHTERPEAARIMGRAEWNTHRIHCAYLPVKEMLAHAPGFRSLYSARETHFEEVYADIVDRAYLPILRGPTDKERARLLRLIEKWIDGKVIIRGEEFFLKNRQGNLEFTLLAEGMRKLALLWLLIQNGTLLEGSVLFWDEPESNLHPPLIGEMIAILIELHRLGVQVFVATHDYVVLKELDLRARSKDAVRYHSFFRDSTAGEIASSSSDEFSGVHPNTIRETFLSLYQRDVERDLAPARAQGAEVDGVGK